MPDFRWSEPAQLAAKLLSEGKYTIDEVAAKCGVSEKTVDRWKKIPEFKAGIQKHLDAILCNGTAMRENRIRAKRRRIGQIWDFLKKRAGNKELGGVEGDPSGLFITRARGVAGCLVEEIALDRSVTRELSALETEIAIEKGEYKRKVEVTHVEEDVSDEAKRLAEVLTPEQLESLIEAIEHAKAIEPDDPGEPTETSPECELGGPAPGDSVPPE